MRAQAQSIAAQGGKRPIRAWDRRFGAAWEKKRGHRERKRREKAKRKRERRKESLEREKPENCKRKLKRKKSTQKALAGPSRRSWAGPRATEHTISATANHRAPGAAPQCRCRGRGGGNENFSLFCRAYGGEGSAVQACFGANIFFKLGLSGHTKKQTISFPVFVRRRPTAAHPHCVSQFRHHRLSAPEWHPPNPPYEPCCPICVGNAHGRRPGHDRCRP